MQTTKLPAPQQKAVHQPKARPPSVSSLSALPKRCAQDVAVARPAPHVVANALHVPRMPRVRAASTEPSTAATTKSDSGRMTYRPNTFEEMVTDAATSVIAALAKDVRLMEVEFPPVPVRVEAYKGSSDLFIDSNVQLALFGAKMIAASGKKVHVVLPDLGEYTRSYKMFKPSLSLMEGVSMGHLNEYKANPIGFSLDSLFASGAPDSKDAGNAADVHIIINATCVELPNVQQYVEAHKGDGKASVVWNLELDTLRGDLGLMGLPPKTLHYTFLSKILPVFYLRPRDYSKSVPVAPFIVNYSGALFREYPGPWQVMLKQDSGEYACIAEDPMRFNLGDVKEEMLAAMGLNTEAEGSTMQTLRRGLKFSTWFEDDAAIAESQQWRS